MKIAYQTSIGLKRHNNEDYVDYFKNDQDVTLAIVADGIGGNRGGDVASKMSVVEIGQAFTQTRFKNPAQAAKWLIKQVELENQQILTVSKRNLNLSQMGTTFVGAIVFKHQYLIGNLGDSRAYSFYQHHLTQLTEDHSYVNELLKNGEISSAEAQVYPYKNVIVRSLGISDNAALDTQVHNFKTGQQLLLCSDGLTDLVSDRQIAAVMNSNDRLQVKCQRLIDLANHNGGNDNITVMIIMNDVEDEHHE